MPDTREFHRAVREIFGLVHSFWLMDAGPRAVMVACRKAVPRSAAERQALANLHTWANRLAEREPPVLPIHRGSSASRCAGAERAGAN